VEERTKTKQITNSVVVKLDPAPPAIAGGALKKAISVAMANEAEIPNIHFATAISRSKRH
jgi:hypothetical protein